MTNCWAKNRLPTFITGAWRRTMQRFPAWNIFTKCSPPAAMTMGWLLFRPSKRNITQFGACNFTLKRTFLNGPVNIDPFHIPPPPSEQLNTLRNFSLIKVSRVTASAFRNSVKRSNILRHETSLTFYFKNSLLKFCHIYWKWVKSSLWF